MTPNTKQRKNTVRHKKADRKKAAGLFGKEKYKDFIKESVRGRENQWAPILLLSDYLCGKIMLFHAVEKTNGHQFCC